MSDETLGQTEAPAAGAAYVPHHPVRRAIAALIDFGIAFVISAIIWDVAVFGPGDSTTGTGSDWRLLGAVAVLAGVILVYAIILESFRGATLGKLPVGVRARTIAGGRRGFGAVLKRNLTKAVVGAAFVFFFFGVWALVEWLRYRKSLDVIVIMNWPVVIAMLLAGLCAVFLTYWFMVRSPLGQRLGDRLAGTVVVRRRAAYPAPGLPVETGDTLPQRAAENAP